MKKVPPTFCRTTPAAGRGRVAFSDRQVVAVTFFEEYDARILRYARPAMHWA